MLPDPLALRGAATALTSTSTEVRRLCAEITATLRDVRWSAPAVDVVRRGLAAASAGVLTGAWQVEAGASHLRAVALAVDDLRQVSRRLRAAAEASLQAELAAATTPVAADAARHALEQLKDADDPSWAAAAGVRPVALPEVGRVPEEAGAPSPPGLVEADLTGVGRLADSCRTGAGAGVAACASTRARVGALGLAGLDPYGLGGSRSEQWLQALASPGSPLAGGADGWAVAARGCDLLVRLLAAADRPGDLLADPRLAEALALLEAQLRGPAAVQAALAALSPADRGWVADVAGVVPAAAQPPAVTLTRPTPVDISGWLHGLFKGVSDLIEEVDRRILALWDEAQAIRNAVRGLGGALEAEGRAQARELMRVATELRRLYGPVRSLQGHLPRWLRSAGGTPLWERGLGGLSRVEGPLALIGVAWDVSHGVPVGAAVTKGVVLTAVGVGVGVLLAGAFVTSPAWLAVGGEIALGTLAGVAANAAYDALAPEVWSGIRALPGVGAAGVRAAERAAGAAERELDRDAHRVSGFLGRIRGMGSLLGAAHARPGGLARTLAPTASGAAAGTAAAVAGRTHPGGTRTRARGGGRAALVTALTKVAS